MTDGRQFHPDSDKESPSPKLGRTAVLRILIAVVILAPVVIWIERRLIKPKPNPYVSCLSNIKMTAMAIGLYQADWDDRLPGGDWIPKIVAASNFKGSSHVFGCPLVVLKDPNAYGYALSQGLMGKDADIIEKPQLTALVFDSVILSRSAISNFSTLPSPPRHGEVNFITFVDGHAKGVKLSSIANIIQ